MINCKYYKKDNKKESKCVKDSSIGFCVVEFYNIECKEVKGYKKQKQLL